MDVDRQLLHRGFAEALFPGGHDAVAGGGDLPDDVVLRAAEEPDRVVQRRGAEFLDAFAAFAGSPDTRDVSLPSTSKATFRKRMR